MSGRAKQRIPEPQTLLAAPSFRRLQGILPVMPFFFFFKWKQNLLHALSSGL